jgi:hypothetical protein
MSLMNAPYLLNEIALALRNLAKTGEPYTLYLTQVPMSDEDAVSLREALGHGKAMIQLAGDAPTVWRESAIPGVWWGDYYEAGGKKIALRTIEIAKIPGLAVTPIEDVRSGLVELEERLQSCMKPQ